MNAQASNKINFLQLTSLRVLQASRRCERMLLLMRMNAQMACYGPLVFESKINEQKSDEIEVTTKKKLEKRKQTCSAVLFELDVVVTLIGS